MRLDKLTALVTGASSGIGQAVTSHFRREGARLLLTGRRERMDTARPDDLYVPGDLNDEAFAANAKPRSRSNASPRPTRSRTPSSSSHHPSRRTSPEQCFPSTAGTPPSECSQLTYHDRVASKARVPRQSERANALFKRTWKALERVTLEPWRIGAITAAALSYYSFNGRSGEKTSVSSHGG